MSESKELKPCFCAGEAAIATVTGKLLGDNKTVTHRFINCVSCGWNNAGITQGWPNVEDAIAHWNTRPREAELEREVERLQSKLDYLEDILPCDLDEMLEEDNDSTN